jgi:hypothetical protein
VHGLGYATGTNRDTAGKALQELVEGGWVRREDCRNKGQFGGITYVLTVPASITHADKSRVANALKKRGVEYRDYEFRTAARVLGDEEIERVRQDVELEIATEQADLTGNPQKAIDLVSGKITRMVKGE